MNLCKGSKFQTEISEDVLRHHLGSLRRGLHLCIGAHLPRAFLAWPVLWVLTVSSAMISASFPAAVEGWLVSLNLWDDWYFIITNY